MPSPKHTLTIVNVTVRHNKDTDLTDLDKRLLEAFRSVEDHAALDDDFIFQRVEVVMDGDYWLDRALGAACEMFSEATNALVAFVMQNGQFPTDAEYGNLGEYGDGLFDIDQKINEIYNLEEDMVGVDALTNAAAIIEHDPFKKHLRGLDAGRWQEDDDPIQSVKNMADDLYQEVVKEHFAKHVNKAAALFRERNLRLANQKQSLEVNEQVIESILTEAQTLDDE